MLRLSDIFRLPIADVKDLALELPQVTCLYPPARRTRVFWIRHVFSLLVVVPVAGLWRIAEVLHQACEAYQTRSRIFILLGDKLTVKFLAGWRLLQANAIFGGKFVVIKYGDVLIDPGPRRAWLQVKRFLQSLPPGAISAILCTHCHEEHIGNAAAASRFLGVPVYGTPCTLAEIRNPSRSPFYRRWYFGQPEPCGADAELHELPDRIKVEAGFLQVVESSGHCDGHVAFYCPEHKLLFSGDSYMGELLTSPTGDVNAAEWIKTLETYAELDIDMVLEGHGELHTANPGIPDIEGLVTRNIPRNMFQRKLAFLRWAKGAVAHGEQQGFDYQLIEACLFPPLAYWSLSTWARDESFRFYSWGGFSRTQFVRSLRANATTRPGCKPAGFPGRS